MLNTRSAPPVRVEREGVTQNPTVGACPGNVPANVPGPLPLKRATSTWTPVYVNNVRDRMVDELPLQPAVLPTEQDVPPRVAAPGPQAKRTKLVNVHLSSQVVDNLWHQCGPTSRDAVVELEVDPDDWIWREAARLFAEDSEKPVVIDLTSADYCIHDGYKDDEVIDLTEDDEKITASAEAENANWDLTQARSARLAGLYSVARAESDSSTDS